METASVGNRWNYSTFNSSEQIFPQDASDVGIGLSLWEIDHCLTCCLLHFLVCVDEFTVRCIIPLDP